jgi:phage terminase small subunit
MALNPKQQRFVEEYLVDLNATQAAIRAGYSERTARQLGAKNMAKPEIAAEIARLKGERTKQAAISEEWVVKGLVEQVNRAMTAVPVLDAEGNPTGFYTYQGNVANRALELLGKHLGMFAERREITGPSGGPVEVRVRIVREGHSADVRPPREAPQN